MRKKQKIRVFFNASVILAGFRSPNGASGTLLSWIKQQKITGVISEIVWNEVLRNTHHVGLSRENIKQWMIQYFLTITAPKQSNFAPYQKKVVEAGDIHLFVSAEESKSDYLVSLDKKHVLVLQKQMKDFRIVSPGELICSISV
jgi:predicted nucleic acid-binding protein